MNKEELKIILEKHELWLSGEIRGKRADLRRANLIGADLRGANLRSADLREANLIGADLRGANLRSANFSDANLIRADLGFSQLYEANLERADLSGANLERADLRGANLIGADLRGANVDFSAWPLWCGSLNVKVDKRLAVQLAYHLCALDCEDKEFQEVRKGLLSFANKIHREDVKELV